MTPLVWALTIICCLLLLVVAMLTIGFIKLMDLYNERFDQEVSSNSLKE